MHTGPSPAYGAIGFRGRSKCGQLSMGSSCGTHLIFPIPCLSALGRGEAGSYRLPARNKGKPNFCLTLLVSIGSFEKSASRLSLIVRFLLASYWKHTTYSCSGLREEYEVFHSGGIREGCGTQCQEGSIRAKNRSAGLDSSVSLHESRDGGHISSRSTAKWLSCMNSPTLKWC
jgi:hypothetical protein